MPDLTSIQTTLTRLVTEGADAVRIAQLAASTWRDIDAALSRIIGQRGVAALYKRSLHLTHGRHPCLTAVYEGKLEPGDFAALQTALSQQTSQNAAAAHGALLQAFYDLLVHLIGASLTQQLLRSVCNPHTSGDAAQDTTP
ncbi:MAG TPA: hypothetical protein VFI62_09200 [Burkholderiales bacterium]|nr:hypothetical protein [Burkholderiales bacterium]